MRQILFEYGVTHDVMSLFCDNLSAINISKNSVQHSRTKNIDIKHHFIRDLIEEKIITIEHVRREKKIGDIFRKALDANQFEAVRSVIYVLKIYSNYSVVQTVDYLAYVLFIKSITLVGSHLWKDKIVSRSLSGNGIFPLYFPF